MSGKSLLFPPVAAFAVGLISVSVGASPVDAGEVAAAAGPGFLGVAVAETRLAAERDTARPVEALVVSRVGPDTPADDAGLRNGDVLLSLDGQMLVHPVQFQRLVAARTPGTRVTLTLQRDGETVERPATLGERPAVDAAVRPAAAAGPMRDDLRQMREQMDRQFEEMRRTFREGMDDGWPGADRWRPLRPMDFDFDFGDLEGAGNVRQVLVSDDGQHRLKLTRDGNGSQHLHATNAGGVVLFDGPVDTAEQRAGLPEPLGEKLERMRSRSPLFTPEDGPGERHASPERRAV
ncbi:MAG: PDZ domain-containing protein [Planctomycetota bacterium]